MTKLGKELNAEDADTPNVVGTISKDKERQRKIRRKLYHEILRQIKPILIGSVAMILSALSNQALPRLMGKFIDQRTSSSSRHSSYNTSSSNIGHGLLVVLGGGLASLLRTTMLTNAQLSISKSLRSELFHALMFKDVEWFQHQYSSTSGDRTATSNSETDLVNERETSITPAVVAEVMEKDINTIATALTTNIANVIRSTSSVVFSTYHMISLDPALFFIASAIVPTVGAAAMLLRKSMKRTIEKQRNLATELASFVEERINHIGLVKMSNKELEEIERFEAFQRQEMECGKTLALQSGLFMGFLFAASASSLLLVVERGGRSVAQGRMTSGQLTSFATYSFLLGLGTSGVVRGLGELAQAKISANRFYSLVGPEIQPEQEINDQATETCDPQKVISLSVENLSFTFKSTGRQVLHDINLVFRRGQVTALVGKNGSGKSTLASVLTGLYKPTTGRVRTSDGHSLHSLESDVRKSIVQLVPQSTAFFNTSILQNVVYTSPGSKLQDVERVMRMVNCDGLISDRLEGVDYVVGVNGEKLSGGERQRLALARALLSNPALLVLDEPASSLDKEGEATISDLIESFRQGTSSILNNCAILLITHDSECLEKVDSVAVMRDGRVVETGDPAGLKSNPLSELRHVFADLK